MDLQELITRGRFLFSRAQDRLAVFELVNGRRSAADIAGIVKRHVNNVQRDLKLLRDAELIRMRMGKDNQPVKANDFLVYEKNPLARTVPITLFRSVGGEKRMDHIARVPTARAKKKSEAARPLPMPTPEEMLDICEQGEGQVHEFKGPGAEVRKITREIAAMLNTRQGGIVFYGVSDDGKIQGTDMRRQKFDQPLQNSVKNSIDPAATITIDSLVVLGNEILVVVVPPWNRSDVYQFEEKVLLRKGTNVFAAKPEELRKLFRGEPVI